MQIDAFTHNPALFTREGRFYDSAGREVLLHGVNLVNKDRASGYLGSEGRAEFAMLREWGFNCLRLGVIWDGLEPQPGVYNQAYLSGLDQRIAWARDNGLYVILDMHQDLYSVLYSDGAPEWATLTGGQPHLETGFVWDDAYFTSPAVQAALDNFWNNAPAPDGVGLQDHYARAWGLLAHRYASEPAVIGYDLMNEPFPGAAAAESMQLLFEQGAKILAELDGPAAPSAEELMAMWMSPEGRAQILTRLDSAALLARVIDVMQPVYAAFERGPLQALYARTAEAIRAAGGQGILFLETSMASNMGVPSAVEPVMVDGRRDPQQAYAPHAYDLVVDTPGTAQASPARVDLIFARHVERARRFDWPALVGEWGAYGDWPGTLPSAQIVISQIENFGLSETFWHYDPRMSEADYFPTVWRAYPERVPGRLVAYRFHPVTGLFRCVWEEDPAARDPGWFYFPRSLRFAADRLTLRPHPENVRPAIIPVSQGTWVRVPPTGQGGRRELIFQGYVE